ncbi:MAG: YkvA family protein [Oculatellaceae cyanobacterium Prado106]|jgi:uncharacterized membrane protein YkvA (DUF1232 family)|nr:YkvA family protein [Oculatellaceae cyanobacterium Prado106]
MKFLIQPFYNWYRASLKTSKYRWLIVLGSLVYLFSPVDLITDVVPVLGWLDDGVIATMLVTEVSQLLLEQRKLRKTKDSEPETVNV